jgi:succinyl-diaminopimelate desuccinylase
VPAASEEQFRPKIKGDNLHGRGSSAGVSEDSQLGRALAASIEDVTGKPARFEMCPGLLEIRFYAEKAVPAFAYGPGLLSVSHGPDEYIRLSDIEASTAVYALTAARFLSPKKLSRE